MLAVAAPRRGPRPPRRRPGRRQDAARARVRPVARPDVRARPGDARPAPGRRHRQQRLRRRHGVVPVHSRTRVHEPAARRRDQPRHAAHPGGAPRGDAGAPGLRRGRIAPAPRAVPRGGDREPGRARGHVQPARGGAGPVPRPRLAGLPGPRRRARDRRALHRPRRAARRRGRGHRRGRDPARSATTSGASPSATTSAATSSTSCAPRATTPICDSGASPRASVALHRATPGVGVPRRAPVRRARRTSSAVAPAVLGHRLLLDLDRRLRGGTAESVLADVIGQVAIPMPEPA